MGFGCYKNSSWELRHPFTRFEILVNKCWPFGQHWFASLEHISAKIAIFTRENLFFVYIQGSRWLYMIWGNYIVGNDSSNIDLSFSNVLEQFEHPKSKISKSWYFVCKISPFYAIFIRQKVILPNWGVSMLVWFQYVRETQINVRSVISYNIVVLYHVYPPGTLYMNENRL